MKLSEYQDAFDHLVILPSKLHSAQQTAGRIHDHKDRYLEVENATENRVPWWFIGIIHYRESDCDFTTYLGNGQSLEHVTTAEPKGRGPFDGPHAFFEGCLDALRHEGYLKVTDWSVANALYLWEKYNGLGYSMRGLPSPYIFGGTTRYRKGKYVSDGKFSSTLVDPQLGCAAILKCLLVLDPTITLQLPPGTATVQQKLEEPAMATVSTPVPAVHDTAGTNISTGRAATAFGNISAGTLAAVLGPLLHWIDPNQTHLAEAVLMLFVGLSVVGANVYGFLSYNSKVADNTLAQIAYWSDLARSLGDQLEGKPMPDPNAPLKVAPQAPVGA